MIWLAAASLLGAAVFIAIIWWVARAHSRMWRVVAARYPRSAQPPIVAKKLETIVVTRRGELGFVLDRADYRRYAGAVIAVAPKGLILSVIPIPPLNLLCPAISLPFDQMRLEQTSWALWPEPFAIRMRNLPDIDIVLGRETVQWIRSQTDEGPFGWNV